MKQLSKRVVSLLLILVLVCSVLLPAEVSAASRKIITTPTGYDSADDVDYQKTGNTIHNWGARGEDCVFLSTYAVRFYTGSNTYDALSELTGSKTQGSVPSSDLYKALKALMVAAHSHQTTYGETRYEYCYTDCVSNDTSMISSFYSGGMFASKWDSGNTWNREHVWPASKSLSGRPGNSDAGEGADIMMLRPTLKSENGSRGNKAFGENTGLGFYDPGLDVRGDCARIALYTYVRWGNASYMWGNSGVIESQNILFKWMQEDPVDTWEMGRNDAVQSITGTRNVFVDYPELAFILFGREVPTDMVTPSGEAKNGTSSPACTHSQTEIRNQKDATCTDDGYTGDTYCKDCGEKLSSGSKISAAGHKNDDGNTTCDVCGTSLTCAHSNTEVRNQKKATCTADGYTGDTYCVDCGDKISSGTKIKATGHKNTDGNTTCDTCGTSLACSHKNTEIRDAKDPTCTEEGYTGDIHCTDCGDTVSAGEAIPTIAHELHAENAKAATCTEEGYTGDLVCINCQTNVLPGSVTSATGKHEFGDWIDNADGSQGRICASCGLVETKNTQTPDAGTDNKNAENESYLPVILIIVGSVLGVSAITVVIIVILKKRKK